MARYDIAVIGSGPAGLTAALYARRAGKSVLVLEKENFGGQITFSPKVENYPTHKALSGAELSEQMLDQVQAQGAELEMDHITAISKDADGFTLTGDYGEYLAKTVILAAGSKHRTLGLPNEENLVGSGVCYCAVCDGAFFKGQDVAVIGGGNTALQDTVLLAELCRSVTIVQNLPTLTGEQALQDKITKLPNVKIIVNATVTALNGDDSLESITIDRAGNTEQIPVTGVFVAIGQKPENDAFSEFAELDSYGYAVSDERCLTQTAGLFVAGDCRTKAIRQVVTAASDGAVAALAACRYLDSL
ncbi:MAG: FAD-dependent oxidoreductase [Oscillospiraceae bacterium]|nr:FAD-dependent oxidoreductase [Oscillospiraceae bacterium]